VPHDLVELALQLLSAPASSASIESIFFSSFGGIHTKTQNHLGNEKTAKLIFCHRNLKHYFTFMFVIYKYTNIFVIYKYTNIFVIYKYTNIFVIYKYTNSDIMIIQNWF